MICITTPAAVCSLFIVSFFVHALTILQITQTRLDGTGLAWIGLDRSAPRCSILLHSTLQGSLRAFGKIVAVENRIVINNDHI